MVLDFYSLLFLIILLIPLVAGLFVIFTKSPDPNKVMLLGMGLIIAATVSMGLLGEKTIHTQLLFMQEPITFSISNTALLLYLGNGFALSIIIYLSSRKNRNVISRFQATLIHLSLIFGFLALMSGQFMIRYIALDVVGLLVALSVLESFSEDAPFKDFITIFQVLRLGDLSLLASILLVNHYARTLDISQMINAASEMPTGPRTWVFGGFLFAILIKLAIWPFGVWLSLVKKSAPRESFWISGFLMPTLGYYLLYRIIPIIDSSILFQSVTAFLGLLFIVLILLASHLKWVRYDRFYFLGSIFSCFSLLAASFSIHNGFGYYLVGLILYRLVLVLQKDVRAPFIEKFVLFFPILLNGLFIWANAGNLSMFIIAVWELLTVLVVFWDWKRSLQQKANREFVDTERDYGFMQPIFEEKLSGAAQWLNQKLEINLFSLGFLSLSESFTKFAEWIQQNVEQGFENAWTWIGEKLMRISEATFYTLELETPEKTGELVDGAIQSLKDYDEKNLKKTLRWDLALIPLFLILILVFLFVL